MTASAARELRAETVVRADAAAVWGVVADPSRMPELSPELVRMVAVKPGGLRAGQWYVGINRRGPVVWPTRNVVVQVDPERMLVWDTTSSGARWVWELQPDGASSTRVVHRRPVPGGLTGISAAFARVALGGADGHADELEAGMRTSLARLKAAVEG